MSTLQKKIKSRDNAVKVIEKAFKNVNKQEEEDVIATLEVIENKFKKICTLNNEIEELADEEENNEEINDIIVETEINIRKKINSLKSSIETKLPKIGCPKRGNTRSTVKLPKLDIMKFSGDYTKFTTFMDSFNAAIHCCEDLNDIEKFNYLRCYLQGEALNTISGISLSEQNYQEALELLKQRYGNKQRIISAHMNELLTIKKIEKDRDFVELRKMYDGIESHVRSLRSLGVDDNNYGSLLTPIIMERLPHQMKLIVSRQMGDDTWNLTQLLTLIQEELKARENCIIPKENLRNTEDNKGGKRFVNYPCTGAGLHVSQHPKKIACVFCQDNHWSDKCSVVTDPSTRREFLKKKW